jgi:hypothetical protein
MVAVGTVAASTVAVGTVAVGTVAVGIVTVARLRPPSCPQLLKARPGRVCSSTPR